jgi:translation initiation factor 5
MAQVNVPRGIDDEFYRYKMPALRAKVEGRGNGIKTVIENCVDISKSLDRNPEYVCKFFGFELGALTSTQNDKYIVNGKHDAEDLAKVLDIFIEKFVLCGGCRNPETNVIIKGDKIFLNCRACGKSTQCDPTNRLVSFMTKRDEKTKPRGTGGKKAEAKNAVGKPAGKEDSEDEEWSLSTTREAVEERRRVTLGLTDPSGDTENPETREVNLTVAPGQNAVQVLSKFWETNPSHEEAYNKITALANSQAWSESTLLRSYLFPSLFASDIKKDFYKKAAHLNLFVKGNKKQQKVVLFCVEKLCQLIPAVIPSLPSFLNGLYEEEVLDEEILIQWYKHPITDTTSKYNPKITKSIRDSAKVFIEWLQNAEQEESEDD